MLQGLKEFFARVSADQALQDRLYRTKEVADVAVIAREIGFTVTPAEIVRAQAGRVVLLSLEELENLAAGKKAKTGAQWGREGNGWLDNAGFWIDQFIRWGSNQPANEQQLEDFFARIKEDEVVQRELLHAKTYNDVVKTAHTYGYDILSSTLIRYMSTQILMLDDEKAEKVACGTR
ncbi:Nif11-like leader peptide family natural product precursor [Candidatus Dependentiae bacterium]|nr:Nif11-like leader peptide family natural product precursor [Candidatus Dependentiae bacterium]